MSIYESRSKYVKSRKLSVVRRDHRTPHRCVKCEARRTLPKLWVDYERPPKCRQCGYYRLYPCFDRVASRHGRKKKCLCSGYWFGHRKGSKFCIHNPNHDRHWQERAEQQEGRA